MHWSLTFSISNPDSPLHWDNTTEHLHLLPWFILCQYYWGVAMASEMMWHCGRKTFESVVTAKPWVAWGSFKGLALVIAVNHFENRALNIIWGKTLPSSAISMGSTNLLCPHQRSHNSDFFEVSSDLRFYDSIS